MKLVSRILIISISVLSGFFTASCDSEFLNEKPRKSLVVPSTIEDYQAILDNVTIMNSSPGLSEIASDDFVISPEGWPSLSEMERNTYIWEKDLYGSLTNISDWNLPFQQIFYSNVVLEGIEDLKQADKIKIDEIRGSALFFRALALFNLSQQFAAPYSSENADALPGIPVRTMADVNTLVDRGTLKTTYSQIITDLREALQLLPATVSYKTRPSKSAAAALLAQIYLHIRDYSKAVDLANESLSYINYLMDYSELDTTAVTPFPVALPAGNKEVIFYSTLLNYAFFTNSLTTVEPKLYESYQDGDYRRSLFFQHGGSGLYRFKGSYTGTASTGSNSGLFSGIAVDEVYLLQAEANIRLGNVDQALNSLNYLLSKRISQSSFKPVTEVSADKVLLIILEEKRKELVGRGKRWSELRRLNLEPGTSVDLQRNLNSQIFKLESNDLRYVFPIPNAELNLNPIEQNPR